MKKIVSFCFFSNNIPSYIHAEKKKYHEVMSNNVIHKKCDIIESPFVSDEISLGIALLKVRHSSGNFN